MTLLLMICKYQVECIAKVYKRMTYILDPFRHVFRINPRSNTTQLADPFPGDATVSSMSLNSL